MRLGLREIGFGFLAACSSGKTEGAQDKMTYSDLRTQTRQEVDENPRPTAIDAIRAKCLERMFAVQRHFENFSGATGGRFDSWDKVAGTELHDCLAEYGLEKREEAESENQ